MRFKRLVTQVREAEPPNGIPSQRLGTRQKCTYAVPWLTNQVVLYSRASHPTQYENAPIPHPSLHHGRERCKPDKNQTIALHDPLPLDRLSRK